MSDTAEIADLDVKTSRRTPLARRVVGAPGHEQVPSFVESRKKRDAKHAHIQAKDDRPIGPALGKRVYRQHQTSTDGNCAPRGAPVL